MRREGPPVGAVPAAALVVGEPEALAQALPLGQGRLQQFYQFKLLKGVSDLINPQRRLLHPQVLPKALPGLR